MYDDAPRQVPWTRQTRTFARRHLRQTVRNRVILLLITGWPVLWYGLTARFLVDSADPGTKVGLAISYGMLGAFTAAVAVFAGDFARDLAGDRYRKFRSMPLSPTADLTGRLLAGTAVGVASYAVTVGVAYLDGAAFEYLTVESTLVIALTLVLFCLVAAAGATLLALAVTKPEQVTTIAVVGALIAYYLTGFNGVQPQMIADGATAVNYLPNSLATRMQIAFFSPDVAFMTPPEAPDSVEYFGLLGGYALVLLAVSVLIVRRFTYAPE